MKNFLKRILPKRLLNYYRLRAEAKKQEHIARKFEGANVECPICGSQYATFGSFGVKNRMNARCHKCKSLERHRLIYLFLKRKLKLIDSGKKLKVLHFAPEKVFYELFDQSDNMHYFPCDIRPELYSFEGTSQVLQVDITNIPFEDNSFDLILCNHVLEHIPEDNKAMKELFRVLRPNGNGIFQVPIDYGRKSTYEDWTLVTEKDREKAFGQKDHVRWYGRDYVDRLREVGFEVNEDNFVQTLLDGEISRYSLSQNELIYHVSK